MSLGVNKHLLLRSSDSLSSSKVRAVTQFETRTFQHYSILIGIPGVVVVAAGVVVVAAGVVVVAAGVVVVAAGVVVVAAGVVVDAAGVVVVAAGVVVVAAVARDRQKRASQNVTLPIHELKQVV